MRHDNWFSANSDDLDFDPFEDENNKNKKRKQRPNNLKEEDKQKMEEFEEEQRNFKDVTSGINLLRMFFSWDIAP